jgi:hypothetical protein
MGANYAWGGYWSRDLKETWLLFVQVDVRLLHPCPHDWAKLDSLQVLTTWLNVTPKAAGAAQLYRGTRKE